MNEAPFELAQYNIAKIKYPIDDPRMSGFVAQVLYVNALADEAPGFVWRHETDEGNTLWLRPYDDDRVLITFSVWKTAQDCLDFVYKGVHAQALREREQWFDHLEDPYIVLWWVPTGTIPTVEEAKDRLEYLQTHGPSPHAFTFKRRFPMPETVPAMAGDVS